jgi:hypothetical protein
MTDTHFRCRLINADYPVVANTLIDLSLNLKTCYGQWPPRPRVNGISLHPFGSFHPFVNFPLAHTVIVLLNWHSSVGVTSLHTLRPQKSDHISLFFDSFHHWGSNVKRIAVSSLLKRQQKLTRCNWRKIHTVYICHLFHCCKRHFWVTLKFPSTPLYFPSSQTHTRWYTCSVFTSAQPPNVPASWLKM